MHAGACVQDKGGSISKEELSDLMDTLGINATHVRCCCCCCSAVSLLGIIEYHGSCLKLGLATC